MKLYSAKLIDDSEKPKKTRKPKKNTEVKKEEAVKEDEVVEEEEEEEVAKDELIAAAEPKVTIDPVLNESWSWNKFEEDFYSKAFKKFEELQENHDRNFAELKKRLKPPSAPKKKKKTIVYKDESSESEEVIVTKKAKIDPSPPQYDADDLLFKSIFYDRRV